MALQSNRLVMQTGPTPGKVFELTKSEAMLGRDMNNAIVINDAEVSRKHARIIVQGDSHVLEDLGSTNGTFVDGQRLMGPHALRDGDLILLGENVSLRYEAAAVFDPDATMVSEPRPTTVSRIPEPLDADVPMPRYEPEYEEPPTPVFSNQVPEPFELETPPLPPQRRKSSRYILAGAGCLLLVCLCLGAFLFVIDFLNLWCDVFPFLFPSC